MQTPEQSRYPAAHSIHAILACAVSAQWTQLSRTQCASVTGTGSTFGCIAQEGEQFTVCDGVALRLGKYGETQQNRKPYTKGGLAMHHRRLYMEKRTEKSAALAKYAKEV